MATELSADTIDVAFRCLLGRHPESPAVIEAFKSMGDLDAVITAIGSSAEAQGRLKTAPYWHYNAQIDPLAIIAAHEKTDRVAVPGRLVNFLGVVIDPAIYPPLLSGREGEIEGLPIPSNWHADIAEFGAALRAVDLAKGRFRVLELGCGWGCWLLNTGVAARNRGLQVELIGAEGDEGHVAFAEKACAENGFSQREARILRGVVGPKPGTALFPRQDVAGASWGLMPVFNATSEQIEEARKSGHHDILPILTLEAISGDGQPIDLVHLDIQGGEASFIESCINDLDRLVAYVVIGTHSREIEGQIIAIMLNHGWMLEVERPAIFGFNPGGKLETHVDGVQGWRNHKLNL